MDQGHPSRTAFAAATHRAAHQLLEGGRVFTDPLALRILGEDQENVRRKAEEDPLSRRMRLFIAMRSRFAEDALAAAVERGALQLVVLGAGLDTYAYRTGGIEMKTSSVRRATSQSRSADSLALTNFAKIAFSQAEPAAGGGARFADGPLALDARPSPRMGADLLANDQFPETPVSTLARPQKRRQRDAILSKD